MLKIKDIYTLPYTERALTDWVLREEWFPGIGDISSLFTSETLEILQSEGRLRVRELLNDYIDGSRVLEMTTVWFDGEPVFIARCAGRGGRDFRHRWLTDAPRYLAMVAYLVSKLKFDDRIEDVVDPETLLYPEEVFDFYGNNLCERFGYKPEPRTDGYLLLPNAHNIVATAEADQILVLISDEAGEPAEYIRRQAFVMRLERKLNEAELASNPRMQQHAASMGQGPERFYWYRKAERPQDLSLVVSV